MTQNINSSFLVSTFNYLERNSIQMSKPIEPPWPTGESSCSETYNGHCHCGTVQYKVTLSPPLHPKEPEPNARWKVVRCNCSICTRNGYLLVQPFTKSVEFTKGQDGLTSYHFGTKRNAHWFCRECGSSIGVDLSGLGDLGGGQRYAMNVGLRFPSLLGC